MKRQRPYARIRELPANLSGGLTVKAAAGERDAHCYVVYRTIRRTRGHGASRTRKPGDFIGYQTGTTKIRCYVSGGGDEEIRETRLTLAVVSIDRRDFGDHTIANRP